MTLFRVGSLTIEGRRELCLIKNISAGGMKVRAYSAIKEGYALTVELKCGQEIAGKAIWVDGSNVGIAFDSPVDVIDLLSASMSGPKPRMPRIETKAFASVREGANVYRLRGCDISQGGIKLQSTTPLPIHSEVVVSLAGLDPQAGTVRWSEDGHVGVTFNRLIPLGQLVGWLQAQRDDARAA